MFTDLAIEWEYLNYKGDHKNSYSKEYPESFAKLIQDFRKKLPNIIIRITTIAVPAGLKAANIPLLLKTGVDKIDLMTHDFLEHLGPLNWIITLV